MAPLPLRIKIRPQTLNSLHPLRSSSSSSTHFPDKNPNAENSENVPPPSLLTRDFKERLRSLQAWTRRIPTDPPPPPIAAQSPFPATSLDETRKRLAEFRLRSSSNPRPNPNPTHGPSQDRPVSFQELKNNALKGNNPQNTNSGISYDSFRESLLQGRSPSRYPPKFMSQFGSKPNANAGPSLIGDQDNLPESNFGREMREKMGEKEGDGEAKELKTEFAKMYSPEELGEKLRRLRLNCGCEVCTSSMWEGKALEATQGDKKEYDEMESNMNCRSTQESKKGSKAIWDKKNTYIFCDICIRAIQKGMCPGSRLSMEGWKWVKEEFFIETGLDYDKTQMKNKWDYMKGMWKLWKDLIGKETGLGWNMQRGTIDAPQSWWDEKIKVLPQAAKFKNAGIEPGLSSKFEIMFGDTMATGEFAWAPSQMFSPVSNPPNQSFTALEREKFVNLEGSAESDEVDMIHIDLFQDKRQQIEKQKEQNIRKRKRKLGSAAALREDIRSLVSSINTRASRAEKQLDPPGYSITEVLANAQSIGEIMADKELFFASTLFEEKSKREIFMSLGDELDKDCIGALDGTHIYATIPTQVQIRFIGRKGIPTQNILAVCDFNLQFTFVMAGWEGTAHDSRILMSAINNPEINFPKPPPGKYYLVDAGYPQMKGFLGPYKGGVRYHLPDFRRGGPPVGYKEKFNKAHSSL